MAGVKISLLPPATSSLPTDLFPAVQGGVTYYETMAQLLALITSGSGITITSTMSGITIAASGSGVVWNDITGTSATMITNNGYAADNAGLVTLTLPTVSAFGDTLSIVGKGAGGWLVAQNTGQKIIVGVDSSTVGTSGSISSTTPSDSIRLLCTVANTTWITYGGPQGNITVT